MKRSTAFELLGGDVASVARSLGCTTQAVYKWCRIGADDPVPRAIADRVLAAAVRMHAQRMRAKGETLVPLEEDAVTL